MNIWVGVVEFDQHEGIDPIIVAARTKKVAWASVNRMIKNDAIDDLVYAITVTRRRIDDD